MLKAIQIRAIELLLSLPTQQAVVRELGISTQCMQVWLKNPEFVRELQQAQRWLFRERMQALLNINVKAVQVLVKQLDSEDEEVAYKAAKAILDNTHPAFLATDAITNVSASSQVVVRLGNDGAEETLPLCEPEPKQLGDKVS